MRPFNGLRRWPAAILAVLTLTGAAPRTTPRMAPRTILFVGNSFTFGDKSQVKAFHPERVTDLNHYGWGGVPALFQTFAREAGLAWTVALEAEPGKDLAFHDREKRARLGGRWDVVILQDYSTLNIDHPGDPAQHVRSAGRLAALFRRANPATRIALTATWARADQVYRPGGPWSGRSIAAMTDDLARANALALQASPDIASSIPVGAAWARAMQEGVADPNPYDGLEFGKVDLWSWDHYHASAAGYYLEALVVFGAVTGVDPRTLGEAETAADELGLQPALAGALQRIAYEEMQAQGAGGPKRM